MARKENNNQDSIVHLIERDNAKGIRFCLHYTINGKRYRETLLNIPWVHKSDKRNYREARAKAEAVQWQRITEIRNGQLGINNTYSSLLFSDWLEQCATRADQRATEGMNRHTWARMIRHTVVILKEYAGSDTRLGDIDKKYIVGFVDYLRNDYTTKQGKRLAPKTADKYYSCIRFCLNEAVRNELINNNPCNLISNSDKIKVPQATREYLNIEELRRLIDVPTDSETTKQVYMFMCCCGLRISDVKKLRWQDIEQDGDTWRMRIVQQKTKDAAYLPLSEAARRYLPQKENATADGLVFAQIPTEQAMNRALKTMAQRAGINKRITLHTARHTFATLELTQGADLYTTSKLLGHTNVRTTQIYAKIIDEKKQKAVDLLNEIL